MMYGLEGKMDIPDYLEKRDKMIKSKEKEFMNIFSTFLVTFGIINDKRECNSEIFNDNPEFFNNTFIIKVKYGDSMDQNGSFLFIRNNKDIISIFKKYLSPKLYCLKDSIYMYVFINEKGFSGNNMLVEQGGVVKAFFIPPYSNNIYTWVSEDGSNIFFTPDMSTMSIYTGGQSVIFKIQAANNNMYAPNNNYNQYNNQNHLL